MFMGLVCFDYVICVFGYFGFDVEVFDLDIVSEVNIGW